MSLIFGLLLVMNAYASNVETYCFEGSNGSSDEKVVDVKVYTDVDSVDHSYGDITEDHQVYYQAVPASDKVAYYMSQLDSNDNYHCYEGTILQGDYNGIALFNRIRTFKAFSEDVLPEGAVFMPSTELACYIDVPECE